MYSRVISNMPDIEDDYADSNYYLQHVYNLEREARHKCEKLDKRTSVAAYN